ncbi:MAG TPA: M20 family metallo-hydrolase [Paludibacteraceae bacterium]|nr:M20 family metallo-hydrolase [Paludibacteraceae bacterium]
MDAIALLKSLITIPSVSRDEKAVADFLEKEMKTMGLVVQRIDNNLWTQNSDWDESKPTILLNAHLDTVKPSDSWTRNPFEAVEENGRIYGLGSNDDGGSLVALLASFIRLTKKEQPYNLIFAASSEEEVCGALGMKKMINHLPKIDFGIVGEPTGMRMAIAEKGLMVLDCKTLGKSGHAARNEGENAIYKALEAIEWFRNYRFEKKSELLGDVKMTVTLINAGTQHNVVPDQCTFVVDVRTNEHYSNLEALDIIRQHVACEVSPRSVNLNSSCIDVAHPAVRRGLELGLSTFGSPTMSDQVHMTFPTLKIGVGDSARSHTADEFVLVSEVLDGINCYVDLLDGLVIN